MQTNTSWIYICCRQPIAPQWHVVLLPPSSKLCYWTVLLMFAGIELHFVVAAVYYFCWCRCSYFFLLRCWSMLLIATVLLLDILLKLMYLARSKRLQCSTLWRYCWRAPPLLMFLCVVVMVHLDFYYCIADPYPSVIDLLFHPSSCMFCGIILLLLMDLLAPLLRYVVAITRFVAALYLFCCCFPGASLLVVLPHHGSHVQDVVGAILPSMLLLFWHWRWSPLMLHFACFFYVCVFPFFLGMLLLSFDFFRFPFMPLYFVVGFFVWPSCLGLFWSSLFDEYFISSVSLEGGDFLPSPWICWRRQKKKLTWNSKL